MKVRTRGGLSSAVQRGKTGRGAGHVQPSRAGEFNEGDSVRFEGDADEKSRPVVPTLPKRRGVEVGVDSPIA
jgi:hypothetical protein